MALAVPQVGGNMTTTGESIAATFGLSTTSGSLLVAVLHVFNSNAFANGDITDNKSGTWTLCPGGSILNGTSEGVGVWYQLGGTRGASHTVTANVLSSGSPNPSMNLALIEITGHDTSTPFDTTTAATSTDSASPFDVTAAAAISGAQIAIYGSTQSTGATDAFGDPAGYTPIASQANGSTSLTSYAGYKLGESGTPTVGVTKGGTVTSARNVLVTFKEAAGAGGDVTGTPAKVTVKAGVGQIGLSGIYKIADRGMRTSTGTGDATLTLTNPTLIAVGSYLIARVAVDNSGTNGARPGLALSDARNGSWTVGTGGLQDPGSASAGMTAYLCYVKVTTPYQAGDALTFDYTTGTPRSAIVIEEWAGIHQTTPLAVAETQANNVSSTAQPAISKTPLAAGQLVYVCAAIEGISTSWGAKDSDTTDGAWADLTKDEANTGTGTTSVSVYGGAKVVTGTTAQTWNNTLGVTSDWAACAVVFDFAPAATNITGTPAKVVVKAAIGAVGGQTDIAGVPAVVTVKAGVAVIGPQTFLYPASISSRKVLDQNGDVILMRTFSSWGMAVQLTDAQITTQLEKLAALGFNAVTVWTSGRTATGWNEYTTAEHGDLFTGTVWQSSLDTGWAAMDWIVSEAARLGMFVNMSFGYGSGGNVAGAEWQSASTTQMRDVGIAVATRYAAAPNIVWHVMFDSAVAAADSVGLRVNALFDGINDTEGASTRPVRWCEPDQSATTYSQGWLLTGDTQFSSNTLYRYQDDSADEFDAVWNESGATTSPVMDCEPPYVGSPHYGGNARQQLRERTWSVFLRGGWGINFGHEDYWSFGGAKLYGGEWTWDQVLDNAVEVAQQSYIFPVLDAYTADAAWAPSDAFVTTGTGSGDTRAAAGASSTSALAYFPSSRTVAVDTTIIAGTGNVRLRWYDPTAGTYTSIAASEAQQTGRSITYPSAHGDSTNDWVLVVDAVAATVELNMGGPVLIV